MRTMPDYLDAAIKKQKLKNDAALADLLGITRSSISLLRNGKMLLSEQNTVAVAKLGGIDEQVALIERSFWTAAEETKPFYEKILRRISAFIPATLFGGAALHSAAAKASVFAADLASPATLEKCVMICKDIVYYGKSCKNRIQQSCAKTSLYQTYAKKCIKAENGHVMHFQGFCVA